MDRRQLRHFLLYGIATISQALFFTNLCAITPNYALLRSILCAIAYSWPCAFCYNGVMENSTPPLTIDTTLTTALSTAPAESPKKICGAKTRTGKPCQSYPMPNGRCRMHGGASLAGIASPSFKDGRRSRYLPYRMLSQYEASINNPELLALREEIAVLDARVSDLMSRVDSGEAGAAWKQAQETLIAINTAIAEQKTADLRIALTIMDKTVNRGLSDYFAWDEIWKLVEQRRRLVESERKRLVEMQQVIGVDRAMVLVAAIIDVLRRHIADRKLLSVIGHDLNKILNANNGENKPRENNDEEINNV
jgi:hypothetical protein